ncbi:MAG: penicillin-binding protein 2 [Acidimicrobiaceae bacterium]|nr:penicillin-binding protein 2 [Acidimicrobiaceae bacterium]
MAKRTFTRESNRGPNDKARVRVIGFAVAAIFSAMFARLYALQVLESSTYKAQAVANQVRQVVEAPPRGLITDRSGNLLVGNKVIESVTLSPQIAAQHPSVITSISKLLNVPVSSIKSSLANLEYSPYEPVPIAQGVSKDKIIYISEHQSQFPGVSYQLTTQRVYPEGTTAAQVLGYVGQVSQADLKSLSKQGYQPGDAIGKSGVEQSFQQYLRGKPGVSNLEVNAFGQVVGTLSQTAPVAGDNLTLSIDLNLQKVVDNALSNEIKQLSGKYDPYFHLYYPQLTGSVVVENPNNGQILAMSSFPTYNPSVWVGGISTAEYKTLTAPSSNYPLINRAIAGEYTPGSTFKLATATAALQSGLINPSYYYYDTGLFTIPNCTSGMCSFHNAGGERLGLLNITKALAASDDVFFYNLGYMFYANQAKYGQDPIQQVANAYGWGQLTGIDLPGEVPGLVDSPATRALLHKQYPAAYPFNTWYTADQIEMAFGQGETAITPIQMANAYATFANGGTRYQPQIASGIVSQSGKLVKKFGPVVTGHVTMSPADRAAMLSGFEGAVQSSIGTAGGAFANFPFNKFPLAGKTGTASVTGQEPNSWFVGFGPVQKPQYVIAAVIKNGGYGASAAAPVVRSIFDYLINNPVPSTTFGVPHLAPGVSNSTNLGVSAPGSTTTSAG